MSFTLLMCFEAHAICKSLYRGKPNMVLNFTELKVLYGLSKLSDSRPNVRTVGTLLDEC